MPDLFDQFLHHYERGERLKAFQLFFPSPEICLDTLKSTEKAFPYFVNFADASIFKGALAYKQTYLVLESLCRDYASLKYIADQFLENIKIEFELFSGLLQPEENGEMRWPADFKNVFQLYQKGILGNEKKIEEAIALLPNHCQELLRPKINMARGWELLAKEKPALMNYLGGDHPAFKQPFHPFSYPNQKMSKIESSAFPIFFLEPIENFDYENYLKLHERCLFVFPTVASLYQLLQFPALQQIFLKPASFLYVLELYPAQQLMHQAIEQADQYVCKGMEGEAFIPALQACLALEKENLYKDHAALNWLYEISKRKVRSIESARYGKERAIAYGIEKSLQDWYDPHKGRPPSSVILGPSPYDYMKARVEGALEMRVRRPFAPKNKIRLAHIVPQIVDGGHAPTKLLKALCQFGDRKWFEIFVASTERLSDHLMSYPIATYASPTSSLRGFETIAHLTDMGVSVYVDTQSPTYEIAIREILQKMKNTRIDIAVFHGPDEINCMISSGTDAPLRVFFDHGTLPLYTCFDLAILSTQEAYAQNREAFREGRMESAVLEYAVDARKDWQNEPFAREAIGLPQDCFAMTTISNHLDTRLTAEMCQAISAILQSCPNAIYAPIGDITDKEMRMAIFRTAGVADRVYFLGHLTTPSQYARSMHLYLNEFPFGSGLSLLDAMSAGCPVVSMYEEAGPQQARYGATYFGKDYVIRSGKVEDYIDLACRLYEDPKLYAEWSAHALEEYEKRADLQAYVRHFENILEQFINYHFNL